MKILMAVFLMVLPSFAHPLDVQSFQLQNGLRVQLMENHQHPLIRLQLRAVWAPLEIRKKTAIVESKGKVSNPNPMAHTTLDPLALGVLDRCSVGHRSRAAFNSAVEERGLSLQLTGDTDGPVWNLAGGSPEAESAFSVLADAVTRPILEGSDLDAMKLRLMRKLREQESQGAAKINFLRLLDRPDLALEPATESSLGRIYIKDLQRHIMMTLRPGRSVLVISGDLNLSQARQLAQVNFGTWNEGTEWSDVTAAKAPKLEAGSNFSTDALTCPPMIVPSERAETCIALPYHASDPKQRAALDLLGLWLPRYLGSDRCMIHPGAAQWRSLILTTEGSEAFLREAVLAVKTSGLKIKDLEQAKTLWIAGRRALALHPQEQVSFASKGALLGAEPSEQEILAVDLATFNSTLRSWLNLDSARVLVFGSGQMPAAKTE